MIQIGETGNDVKDAFLNEAKKYLNAVASVLTGHGYLPQDDAKGRAMKPVSVNEAGVAVSGEVSLAMHHPDGGGIFCPGRRFILARCCANNTIRCFNFYSAAQARTTASEQKALQINGRRRICRRLTLL